MYEYLFGITILKISNPYFRKHILYSLDPHDLLFINGIIMFIIISLVFLYQITVNNTLKKTIANYKKLSYTQILCLIILCCMAIASSLLLFELDKNHNTPFINHVFLKAGSIILLLLISIFLFEEKYNYCQIIGIILTIIGIVMVTFNDD
jgi:uncharacterized membrane protein